MVRRILVAVVGAMAVVGAFVLLGPRRPVAAPPSFPRYTAAEREAGVGRVIAEARFDGVTMEKAVAELARASGTTIVVNWEKLDPLDPEALQQTPVYVQLHNVEVARAIEAVYGDVEGGKAWRAEEGKTLVPAAGGRLVSRVYDVEDLIAQSVALDASLGVANVPVNGTSPADLRHDAGKRLEEILREATVHEWDGTSTHVDYWSGRVLAVLTRAGHRKMENTLNLMRTHRPPATRPADDLLARQVPAVQFQQEPLREALAELARSSGADFVIDWRGLGLDPNRRINLLMSVPGPLWRAVELASARCHTDDGIVVIGLSDRARRKATLRVYDVRDIIRAILWHFTGPVADDVSMWSIVPRQGAAVATAQEEGEFLAHLVDDRVQRGSGFTLHFAGRLVVQASEESHGEVVRFLAGRRGWFSDEVVSGREPESWPQDKRAGKP